MILFTLLFTVGTEYFIFVNNANTLETQSLIGRGNALAARLEEEAIVTTKLNSGGYVEFYLNNTGGATLNVTSAIVLSSAGTVLECDGVGLPAGQGCGNTSPGLPQAANVGRGTQPIVTNYKYVTGTVVLKLTTSTGNVFSATYPETGVSLASQALSSGAIGDIYIQPQSYTYYEVCTSPSGTCSPCTSGTCFIQPQAKAFTIPAAFIANAPTAFSVNVTDFNPQQANITLDQYSFIEHFWGKGSSFRVAIWYCVSVSGKTLQVDSSYEPITLIYDKPTVLYFASASPGGFVPYSLGGSNSPPSSTIASVFIISHGWEGVSTANLATTTQNYGQNSPYVSTLYT